MATSFRWLRPLSAPFGLKEGSQRFGCIEVGFYPFRGPDASFNAPPMLSKPEEGFVSLLEIISDFSS
jgi:hypothetical protein